MELYQRAKNDPGKKISHRIVDAITTNETYFFRDTTPFELLKYKVLPDLIDRYEMNGKPPYPLHIWSAACSTGQEVYSTAITIKELLPDLSRYRVKILGTDISDAAIAQASYGWYLEDATMKG
jgi:chemotaxis protein methyltransferase CheR